MNPIVKLAASALPGKKKYILFAGAGVSKDADIPTAWDLMLQTASYLYASENPESEPPDSIEDWFVKSEYAGWEYSKLMEELYPHSPEQQDFLKQQLTGYDIGEVHYGIAELARRGIIRAVVTTNFDHYIEKALQEIGIEVQVISTDEDLQNSEPLIHCKNLRIYKPHGTLGRGALKNTPRDVESLSQPMEEELTRVMSEHGLIVLGYAGRDPGIQTVFRKRQFHLYPTFWVNRERPVDEMEQILNQQEYVFVPCEGASSFIDEYLQIMERLKSMAPGARPGPQISDLRDSLQSATEPAEATFRDFLENLSRDLEKSIPDFSQYEAYDDAIIDQIQDGIPLSGQYIEACILAAKYGDQRAIKQLYHFFGLVMGLYTPSDDFSGRYTELEFDGIKFLGFEMFVGLVTALMRYDRWELLGLTLKENLFIDKERDGGYFSYPFVSRDLLGLDKVRKERLGLNRVSIQADLLKERFTQGPLSNLLSHNDFLEADYFLFTRSVCLSESPDFLFDVWAPRACLYLRRAPRFIRKAESHNYLMSILPALGFDDPDTFISTFKNTHHFFSKFFNHPAIHSPVYREIQSLASVD